MKRISAIGPYPRCRDPSLLCIGGRHLYLSRPGFGLPYYARFLPDVEDRWNALGGTWDVADGSMRNDSNDRGAKLLTGSPNWKDYVVEGDVHLLGEGSVGVLARVRDAEVGENSFKGYLAGVRRVISLFLGVFDFAYHEAAKVSMPEAVRPFRWYHVRLKVEGCQITASVAPGMPEVKTPPLNDPDCFRSGSSASGPMVPAASGGRRGGPCRCAAISPAVTLNPKQSREHDCAQSPALGVRCRPHRRSSSRCCPCLRSAAFGFDSRIRGAYQTRGLRARPTGGVEIQSGIAPPLKIGDEVEVTGEVSLEQTNPVIRNARFRLLREAVPISPVVGANQLADGYFDGRFVQVEGYLRTISPEKDGTATIRLDAGAQSFHAILPAGRSRSHLRVSRSKAGFG